MGMVHWYCTDDITALESCHRAARPPRPRGVKRYEMSVLSLPAVLEGRHGLSVQGRMTYRIDHEPLEPENGE